MTIFTDLDRTRLDLCNVVEAMRGIQPLRFSLGAHDDGHVCLALLELGLEMAKEIEPEMRGLLRTRISKVADEVAYRTAALHQADVTPKRDRT